jgi:hypothetical protein
VVYAHNDKGGKTNVPAAPRGRYIASWRYKRSRITVRTFNDDVIVALFHRRAKHNSLRPRWPRTFGAFPKRGPTPSPLPRTFPHNSFNHRRRLRTGPFASTSLSPHPRFPSPIQPLTSCPIPLCYQLSLIPSVANFSAHTPAPTSPSPFYNTLPATFSSPPPYSPNTQYMYTQTPYRRSAR